MTTRNNVKDTASDVAQYKKVRVRVLGRGARSKSKRQSPPSAGPSGSSTNVLATRLERRRGAAQSNRTQDNVAHSRQNHHNRLLFGNWNVFTLTGKEMELVDEAKRYHLDIVGISSTKRRGSGIVDLDGGWKLFYSGADPSMSSQAGVGILTSPQLADCVSEWIPLQTRDPKGIHSDSQALSWQTVCQNGFPWDHGSAF